MADTKLPDINAQINALPYSQEVQDKLYYAFYDDDPYKALESIKGVPSNVKQALFDIRGKAEQGQPYSLEDIYISVKPSKKGAGLAEEEKPKEEWVGPKEALREREFKATTAIPVVGKSPEVSPTPFAKKKEVEVDFLGRPVQPKTSKAALAPKLVKLEKPKPGAAKEAPEEEAPVPATAPPPVVAEPKTAEPPAPLLSREEMESRYSNYIKEQAEKAGKEARPKTAEPPKAVTPTEESWLEQAKKKVTGFVSSLTEGEKPEMPASPKLAQAKAVIEQVDKPILSTDIKDYSIGAGLAEKYPNLFVPISKQVDPTSLSATDTYEAWKEIGANLMSRALGVPVSKVKTDISNIVGAQFLDEAAKTAPELFDFMSSPGGLGYLAAGVTTGKVRQLKQLYNAMTATDLGAMFSEEMKRAVDDPTERNIAKAAKALGFLVLGVKDQIKPVERVPKPAKKPTPGLEPPTVEAEFEVVGKEAPKTEGEPGVVETKPAIAATAEIKKPTTSIPLDEQTKTVDVKHAFTGVIKPYELPQSVAEKYESAPADQSFYKDVIAQTVQIANESDLQEFDDLIKESKQALTDAMNNPSDIEGLPYPYDSLGNLTKFVNEIQIPYLEYVKSKKEAAGQAPVQPQAAQTTPAPPSVTPQGVTATPPSPAVSTTHPKLSDAGEPVVISKPSTPTPDTTWEDASKTAVFTPTGNAPVSIGKVEMKSWNPPQDGWSKIPGTKESLDVRKPFEPIAGKKTGAGVIVVEDDGRIWLISPTNEFGGYKNTFPKGTVDPSLTMQENAIKEAWEETGLKVDIIGVLGDYERGTSKARYYIATRSGGSPKDMGWEAQAVNLATITDAKSLLNQQVDQKILTDLENMISSGKLGEIKDGTPRKLSSYGPEKAPKTEGSNPGGWYGDQPGDKWLIKGNKQKQLGTVTPEQSDNRASNEVLASELIRSVIPIGAPKMKLVDLEGKYGGGLGVASKAASNLTQFDKNNPDHLSAAQKTFALHAWLANYDVLGMGYDNTFITPDGNAINIDPGGALLFRAQGLPKGASHGVTNGLLDPSAPEFESMRTTTPEQKAVFGKMTQEQLKQSAEMLEKVTDEQIKKLVNTYGWGDETTKADLADNLIKRRDAILGKVGLAPKAQPTAISTVQPPVTPAPPAAAPISPPPGQILPSWQIQSPSAASAASQPTPVQMGTINSSQYAIQASVPKSVARAWSSTDFSQYEFHDNIVGIMDSIYSDMLSGSSPQMALQDAINSAQISAGDEGLNDAKKNAWDKGIIPYLEYLSNKIQGKSSAEVKDILNEEGKSLGMVDDWQSTAESFAASLSQWTPEPPQTPPTAAATTTPPPAPAVATQPPPQSATGVTQASPTGTAVIDFPPQNVNAVVPASVYQAFNTPGFNKQDFFVSSINGVKSIYSALTLGYTFEYAINEALSDASYYSTLGPSDPSVKKTFQEGVIPYLEYLKQKLQGKSNQEIGEELKKEAQSFGSNNFWVNAYGPIPSSTPASTQAPPSPAVATQPPPTAQTPVQPTSGSQIAAAAASSFLAGGTVNTQDLQVPGGSFSVPDFVMQSYQAQTAGNQSSFKKRLVELKDGTYTADSLLSVSQSKLSSYKDKIDNGTASQFDVDRVKYLEDLLIPYLEFLKATGTTSAFTSSWTNVSGGYSYPSGTSISLPAGQIPPAAAWTQSLIGKSLLGKDKPLKDKVEALNFYVFANEIYGPTSSITKKALRRFKTLQKTQGAIDDATIEAAKNDAALKYGPFKHAYSKADQVWALKLFKYAKEPSSFNFAWNGSNSSAKEKQLFSDFTSYQENAINTKLTNPEVGVINSYTGSLYSSMNGSLAEHFIDGATISQSSLSSIKKIDSALSKVQLGFDMILKRAVPSHFFWAQHGYAHGTSPSISDLKSWIGKTYTEVGVASTSINPSWQKCIAPDPYGKIVMKIKAGKEAYGVKAYGTPISGVGGEWEVLLPRGTTFVIRSIQERAPDASYGKPIWDIEVDLVDQTPAKVQ